MIFKLYYRIWVDAIIAAQKKNAANDNGWKYILLIAFSVAQGINLLTIFFLLVTIGFKIDIFIDFDIFPGTMLDGFLSAFITLFLPFIIFNYFMIFWKNRFEILKERYSSMNSKGIPFVIYVVVSGLIFIIPIIIGKWIL